MTMLNAAPTAASVPTGTSPASASPAPFANPVPVPAQPSAAQHHEPAREREAGRPDFHVLGSGGTSGATGVADRPNSMLVPLDQFSKQSGPDASVKTATGDVSVHAVFQLDAKTRELSVAIVNEDGQLVRLIPPESVARMIAAMATYRGR
jgi:hypothetical protein